MSEIILPNAGIITPGMYAIPEVPQISEKEVENIPVEDRAKQLPEPKGWMILAAVIDVPETFEGSNIIRAEATRKSDEMTSPVLYVMQLGPEAYLDEKKFPSGPRCKEGDFILTRPYAGTRVKIHGKEFRLLNDDQVEATVQDPRGISRA
jgi:co-chaperonin GroES (HSP10)